MESRPASISEIKAFLNCRLAWFWAAPAPRGLGLEAISVRPALHTGRLAHKALQVYYDQGEKPDAVYTRLALESVERMKERGAWQEEIDAALSDTEVAVAMLRTYANWAQLADRGIRFLALETKWEMKLGGYPVIGRYDAFIEKSDGLWVLDFKTTSYSTISWTDKDLQATTYVMAARAHYGDRVAGQLFRFLLKKQPYTYEKLILKGGGVTSRKDIAELTTYENYYQALAIAVLAEMGGEEGMPVLSYPECEAYLAEGLQKTQPWYGTFKERLAMARRLHWDALQALHARSSFVWEDPQRRTGTQLDLHAKHVILPALREMHSGRPWVGPTGLGTAWASCPRCAFKAPCELVMSGGDYKTCLRTEFQPRVYDYESEPGADDK